MASREDPMLDGRVRVPDHVVYREFPDETVILNLESGMYHGLNRTAARMLEVLRVSASMRIAIDELTAELGQPRAVIKRDVLGLCRALGDRGLITQGVNEPE